MEILDLTGYLAALLMFSTFYMKKMIPLRAVGIASNVVFIVFATSTRTYPILILHACLLPLNISRMVQMIRLVNKVKAALSGGGISMDFLVPFMTRANYKKGDTLFKKGDDADKMFFLRRGLAKVVEVEAYIKEGELVGEVGVFALNKKRTATIICETDCNFLSIPENQVLQLCYQNPTFGLHLMQLMIQRFERNTTTVDDDTLPKHMILQPGSIAEVNE